MNVIEKQLQKTHEHIHSIFNIMESIDKLIPDSEKISKSQTYPLLHILQSHRQKVVTPDLNTEGPSRISPVLLSPKPSSINIITATQPKASPMIIRSQSRDRYAISRSDTLTSIVSASPVLPDRRDDLFLERQHSSSSIASSEHGRGRVTPRKTAEEALKEIADKYNKN